MASDRRTVAASLLEAYDALHKLTRIVSNCVPTVRRGSTEPWSTCLGCGKTDSAPCLKGCWVLRLEIAIADAEEALRRIEREQRT